MDDFTYTEKYSKEKIVKFDFAKFCNTMKQKWITPQCQLCHQGDFALKRLKIHTGNDNEGMTCDVCEVMPLVAIICKNCGHTVFVNPMVIDCLVEN